jgi:hypothetical protein
MATRQSWLDGSGNSTVIDEYVQKLSHFVEAMADGRVDAGELAAQEKRLTTLMREVEPTLDDAAHARITRLLCELTAYNVMQTLHALEHARPKSAFRG